MATSSSKNKCSYSSPVIRSSNSDRFYGSKSTNTSLSSASSSSFASSTSSSFSSPSSTFFSQNQNRSASPTRVNLYSSAPLAQSFRFSIDNDRSGSPSRSIAASKKNNRPISAPRRTCMCSPTTHRGSFRCSLHKNVINPHGQAVSSSSHPSTRLNMRRSAMTNSLVRIGGVEGEWVKRALTALIRPSSHQQRRRAAFQPGPSRLSIMSKAKANDN